MNSENFDANACTNIGHWMLIPEEFHGRQNYKVREMKVYVHEDFLLNRGCNSVQFSPSPIPGLSRFKYLPSA